jgi:hypothetical protein
MFHGKMVIPPGFEPGTHSLEGCCSIQLSYGTILMIQNDPYTHLKVRCHSKGGAKVQNNPLFTMPPKRFNIFPNGYYFN